MTANDSYNIGGASADVHLRSIVYIDPSDRSFKLKNANTSQIILSSPNAVTVLQKAFDTLPEGGLVSIKNGTYPIVSNNLQIPNTNNITIEGDEIGVQPVLDARNIRITDPRTEKPVERYDQLGVLSRSSEDNSRAANLPQIKGLTIRNLSILSFQTGKLYLENKFAPHGIRTDNVNNLIIENISTQGCGISIQSFNVSSGIISACRSTSDAAGPTISTNCKNILVQNCYTFGSFDDSFACLGTKGTTNITWLNCIADKGIDAPPTVGASCFKLDAGGIVGGVSGIKYLGCYALNAKPGRGDIQGGFINGDPKGVSNIMYENCSAINCNMGMKVAGTQISASNCIFQDCNTALVTEVNSPGATFKNVRFVRNANNTNFLTPAQVISPIYN